MTGTSYRIAARPGQSEDSQVEDILAVGVTVSQTYSPCKQASQDRLPSSPRMSSQQLVTEQMDAAQVSYRIVSVSATR